MQQGQPVTMIAEIPWDKSRMEWKPVDMTVTYNGDGALNALTSSGITFPMEAPVGMGGHGKVPNPIHEQIRRIVGMVESFRILGIGKKCDCGLLRCGNAMRREKGLIERHDGE